MVFRPESGRPMERRGKVTHDHAGRRTICPCGPSWVGEGDPGLFYWQTDDRPPRDLNRGPLKEVQEEDVLQHILDRLEGHPYVWGGNLNKGPLLLEGIL